MSEASFFLSRLQYNQFLWVLHIYGTTAFTTYEMIPGLCPEVNTQKVFGSSLQNYVCVGISERQVTCPELRQRARKCVSWKIDYAWVQRDVPKKYKRGS